MENINMRSNAMYGMACMPFELLPQPHQTLINAKAIFERIWSSESENALVDGYAIDR